MLTKRWLSQMFLTYISGIDRRHTIVKVNWILLKFWKVLMNSRCGVDDCFMVKNTLVLQNRNENYSCFFNWEESVGSNSRVSCMDRFQRSGEDHMDCQMRCESEESGNRNFYGNHNFYGHRNFYHNSSKHALCFSPTHLAD